jgi:hypothetical protein
MPRGGGDQGLTPELLRAGIDWLGEQRAAQGLAMDGYDIVAEGTTPPDPAAAAEIVRPWAEAGATWWIDADWSDMDPGRVRAAALERLRAGPPRR